MNQKKIIVTGGAGFIGSHLVDCLLSKGHNVIAIDNLYCGSTRNLEEAFTNSNFSFIKDDVINFAAMKNIFIGADCIFHLAALADIVPSIQQPTPYHRANVDGTISVLEAARMAGVKKFVYTASSSCYGIPDTYPTSEASSIHPMYPYALTKNVGEQYVQHWHQTYGLPTVSLRVFNVYGPRARTGGTYGAVFGVFLAQKLAGEPYTIIGDGEQTRDFTYVSDIVNALVMAFESDLTGEVMNVGSGNTYSINRLIELLGGPFQYIPKRPGEPDCTFADITKIQKLLSWKPEITLEEGVGRMLENIDYWKDAPVWTPDTIEEATEDWFKYLSPNREKINPTASHGDEN